MSDRVINLPYGRTVLLRNGRAVATKTTPDDLVDVLVRHVADLEDAIKTLSQGTLRDMIQMQAVLAEYRALDARVKQLEREQETISTIARLN